MPPVGFELTVSAGKWPQSYALDRAAIRTSLFFVRFFVRFFKYCTLYTVP